MRTVPTLIVAGAVLATAFTGLGVAVAAGGPTRATACLTGKGNLAVPKQGHCARGQRTISIPLTRLPGPTGRTGATGKTGATGRTGATGKTGATGTPGVSDAHSVARTTGPADLAATPVVVATLANLPAGAWAVTARTEVDGPTPGIAVTCSLTAQSDVDTARAITGPVADLPLSLTHTFTGTGVVTVSCTKAADGGTTPVSNTRITAVRVGSETHADVTG